MFNSAGLGGGYTMSFTGNDLSALLSGEPIESINWQYSADSMWEGDDSEKEALHNEKSAMRYYLLNNWKLPGPLGIGRKKNSKDSIECRKHGNDFYNSKMSDDITHAKVWRLYTQSIALAPNDSAELALGYGNRSALLFHLQKYEDCIKDCDRAIEIATVGLVVKGKLICRKAECIAFLNKNSAKSACDDALKKLSELTIIEDVKKQFIDKINNILKTLKTSNSPKQMTKPDDLSELVDMKYQKEAPYASKSVKIHYSKQWGRHVTATKDIKPGDIVAIPDNFCTLLNAVGMYSYCSNCVQPAWSSIPCKQCIFDVYCSEECMAKAWDKYHKYECAVNPCIWDINAMKFTNGQKAIRLVLIMIHNAGGIEQLKKIVNDVENCKDLRTKGFSPDGIFHSDSSRSMYSHMCGPDHFIEFSRIQEAALHLYLLVAQTDLFGIKTDVITGDMLVVDDMLFVGALLTRIDSVFEKHLFVLTHEFGKGLEEKVQYAISFNAFNSLFNHSCDPNIEIVPVKNNKTVIYAKRPIKEGEQLFVSYRGHRYLWATKQVRQKHLKEVYGFKCRCMPCSENWSNICVPSFDEIFDVTPGLIAELKELLDLEMKTEFRKSTAEKDIQRSLRLAKKIKLILEILSTKLTAHCSDYNWYDRELMALYTICFGDWTFDISHKCINA